MGRAPRIVAGAGLERVTHVYARESTTQARWRPSALFDEHEQILVRPSGRASAFQQAGDSGQQLVLFSRRSIETLAGCSCNFTEKSLFVSSDKGCLPSCRIGSNQARQGARVVAIRATARLSFSHSSWPKHRGLTHCFAVSDFGGVLSNRSSVL